MNEKNNKLMTEKDNLKSLKRMLKNTEEYLFDSKNEFDSYVLKIKKQISDKEIEIKELKETIEKDLFELLKETRQDLFIQFKDLNKSGIKEVIKSNKEQIEEANYQISRYGDVPCGKSANICQSYREDIKELETKNELLSLLNKKRG